MSAREEHDVVLRRAAATGQDDAAVGALLAAVFPNNPKADVDVRRWQYHDNPYGPAVTWLAEVDGEAVACVTGIALPVLVNGRATIGRKIADAATLPAHRGQQLFPRMLDEVLQVGAAAGEQVAFSHPANPASLRPQVRLGMQVVTDAVPVFVAPLDASRLTGPAAALRLGGPLVRRWLRRSAKAAPSPDVRALDLERDAEHLDELWARHRPAWGVAHDATWWRWRHARPDVAYCTLGAWSDGRLVGAVSGRVRDILGAPFLHVLDLQADTDDGGVTLLTALVDAEPTAAGIAGIALPGSRLARHLQAARLVRVPARLAPRFAFGAWPVDRRAAASPSLAEQDWTLAWTDLDHV